MSAVGIFVNTGFGNRISGSLLVPLRHVNSLLLCLADAFIRIFFSFRDVHNSDDVFYSGAAGSS